MSIHSAAKEYKVVGVMSGTSLDGIDIAAVTFPGSKQTDSQITPFSIAKTRFIPYSEDWYKKLSEAHLLTGLELLKLDLAYGNLLGKHIQALINDTGFDADLIASHGHTVFHNPAEGYTFQAGNGAAIANITRKPVVCDFRISNVLRGGQGAPLVPFGEKFLFPDYNLFLNLGGIANISYVKANCITAFDITACNIILNETARNAGLIYDQNGMLSQKGTSVKRLINAWDTFSYYNQKPPKSLDKEQVLSWFRSVPELNGQKPEDIAASWAEHLADKVHSTIQQFNLNPDQKVLVTGGGALNPTVVQALKIRSGNIFTIPDKKMVTFKEAVVFAFLGLRRMQGKNNVSGSATGSGTDHISGTIF